MKQRYIAIFVMGLAMWLCACETEMMGYEGESGIYFTFDTTTPTSAGSPPQGTFLRDSL